MPGKVILVGAGPGDPGLLTLKGREALESADVVLYDRLVGDGILKMIPKGTKKSMSENKAEIILCLRRR